jgi:hypothetical protein
VFNEEYKLRQLTEVESFIKQHKHLPDVPNEAEVKSSEVDVFEMQKIQMQKIEELTLYTIALQKRIEQLNEQIMNLKK